MNLQTAVLANPAAVQNEEIRAQLMTWNRTDLAGWYEDLADRMQKGKAVIIIGASKETSLDSTAIVTLPDGFSEELPWVVHFHNHGPRALTKVMIDTILAFIKDAGYTAYKALNQSGHPDKIWLRAFKSAGTPQFIGSTYLFDLREPHGSNSASDRRGRKPAGRRGRPKAANPKHVHSNPARRKLVKSARPAKRAKRSR